MALETENKYIIEWDVDTKEPNFYKVLTIDAEHKDIINTITKLQNELALEPSKREWKSKHNSYVVYDYEPFCTSGFYLKIYYPLGDKTDFLQYLLDKHLSNINVLENYYKLQGVTNNENK